MSGESLDGLEEFSHVWLTFKFHLNTNTLKEARAFGGVVESSQRYTFTAKVLPHTTMSILYTAPNTIVDIRRSKNSPCSFLVYLILF